MEIVERGYGRVGDTRNYARLKDEWNQKYGEGNWERGYFYKERFYPYEDAGIQKNKTRFNT